ncbi:GAF domain-containing protein [Streptomyces sp. P01-B04]|uniref:ATP-binding protein n=1 Tax=Streptomyces poriferorum TaxID=2798799 RepID=UPI001C605467|nr:ATP-binding protein [Streptomyces poriferorum]MBW5252145.1 GAF domain-containing protein [Streptomyces poriferorum]MBW5257486.1 GAF domain-containing protein [Streptomyces poriferorum]
MSLPEPEREAEAAAAIGFDLSVCVREPIHRLGMIQSHGTLLAVEADTGTVDTAALNTLSLLGIAAEELVGGPITRVLSPEHWAEALQVCAQHDAAGLVLPVSVDVAGAPRMLDVTAHRQGPLVVLEYESRAVAAPHFPHFYQAVRRALTRLRSSTTAVECCQAAAREIRALTGFDRVVAYRFDGENGPGEVVAEDVTEGREPWLGLWFPASDIPPQARRLYRDNWIRVIADVDDTSVGLHPPLRAGSDLPLDLSNSVLRTVSGFHLEYLRNIDVKSSMSVSVLREGELWGLIACHGYAAVTIPPEMRAACEFFGVAFSLQLAVIEEREQAEALTASRERLGRIISRVTSELEDSLLAGDDALRDLLHADGAVLCRGGHSTISGMSVPPALLEALRVRAAGPAPGTVWSTDRLSEEPDAPDDLAEDGPAGVLMVTLSGSGDYLAWFREARPTARQWATDPSRPVQVGPRGERLTPRGSGAVFRAVVHGQCLPWTPTDRATAHELWRTLTGVVLRHEAELAALNERLRISNSDLDSFAHVVAHDLKEPLRGISNAATFVIEDAGAELDATTVRRMHTMRRLAGRMDDLLDSLLHFARLGRGGLHRTRVPLDRVLDSALDVAGERLAEAHVRVVRHDLPEVYADEARLYEVLVNLLVNAAKYASDRDDRAVEVLVAMLRPPAGGPPQQTVVVRDNGIGIPPDQQREVFELFRRLHGQGERGGGTGVGLAIVRRIVERHGGELWLDSAPGRGTAFFFTLGQEGG